MRYLICSLILLLCTSIPAITLMEVPDNKAFMTNAMNMVEITGPELYGMYRVRRGFSFGNLTVPIGYYSIIGLKIGVDNMPSSTSDVSYVAHEYYEVSFAQHFWRNYSYGLSCAMTNDRIEIDSIHEGDTVSYETSPYALHIGLGLSRRFPIATWRGTHTIGLHSMCVMDDIVGSPVYLKKVSADWLVSFKQEQLRFHGSLGSDIDKGKMLYSLGARYFPPSSEVALRVQNDTVTVGAGWRPAFLINGSLGLEFQFGDNQFGGGLYLNMVFRPARETRHGEPLTALTIFEMEGEKVEIFAQYDKFSRNNPFKTLRERVLKDYYGNKIVSKRDLFRDDIVSWNIAIFTELGFQSHLLPYEQYVENGGIGLNNHTLRLMKSLVRAGNADCEKLYHRLDSIAPTHKIVRSGKHTFRQVSSISMNLSFLYRDPIKSPDSLSIFQFRNELAQYYLERKEFSKALDVIQKVPRESKYFDKELLYLVSYLQKHPNALDVKDQALVKAYVDGREAYLEQEKELLSLFHEYDTKEDHKRIDALIYSMKPYYKIIKQYRSAGEEEKLRILKASERKR